MTECEARRQLRRSGYDVGAHDLVVDAATVRGVIALSILPALRADLRFHEGPFHLLHADIPHPRTEFRSYRGTLGPGSMQFVINTDRGLFYADIDKFSPYEDVVGVVGHLFGEVLPHWVKKWTA